MLRLTMTALVAGMFLASCGGGQTESHEAATDHAEGDHQEHAAEMAEEKAMPAGMIDTEASTVNWKGEMLGVYDHFGNIAIKSGNIEVTDNMISGGSIVIDMTTIEPTDENYSEDHPASDLVGHLSSDDFFAVETYPEASFTITGAENGKVMGDLTIRDKTNPVTVEEVMYDAESGVYSGNLVVKRRDFDVVWDSPIKENVLSDDITLAIKLAVK